VRYHRTPVNADVAHENKPLRAKFRWLLLPLVGYSLPSWHLPHSIFHDIEMYGDQSATLSSTPRPRPPTASWSAPAATLSSWDSYLGAGDSDLLLLHTAGVERVANRRTGYAFAIGLLTVAYSVYLITYPP
jgi:hypothetical protein